MSTDETSTAETSWQTHPVTPDRVARFAAAVNPNHRESHCWRLWHRLPARCIENPDGGSRERAARALCERGRPVDHLPARVTICAAVRGGYRGQGEITRLIEGGVAWAASARAVDAPMPRLVMRRTL